MYFLVKTLNRGHIDYNHMDIDYKGYLDHFNILVLFNFWRPSQGYTLNYFKKKKIEKVLTNIRKKLLSGMG